VRATIPIDGEELNAVADDEHGKERAGDEGQEVEASPRNE
jgi:hypothetical protein